MNNILEKIIATKQKEIFEKKKIYSKNFLEKSFFFKKKCISLYKKFKNKKIGIISEFKRCSPIKGIINNTSLVKDVIIGYEKAGSIGISILTDKYYFHGKNQDLIDARENTSLPILCKDFIIDEYQIILYKSFGADIILLISKILSKNKIKNFAYLAKELNMEVLMEVHSEKELDKINEYINFIGINNRNLKTWSVDIKNSVKLSLKIPKNFIKISESGLSNPDHIIYLNNKGFKGFLIGENFMKSKNPGKTCKEFIKNINYIL